MTTAENFWNKIAHSYAKSPVRDMASYDQTMERTRAYLNTDDQTLELGGGTGTTALRLADAVGHITSTDISTEMIAIARGKADSEGVDNVTFRRAAINDAADAHGPYDAVLAFNLLHLIEDLPGALTDIHAMVKPGGLFISKSGCLAEKGWYLRVMVRAMRMIGKAPYVGFLTIRDLDDQVEQTGFKIIETRTFPGMAPTRFIVARRQ